MKRLKKHLSIKSPLTILLVIVFAAAMTYALTRTFAAVGPATLYSSPGGNQSVTKDGTFAVTVRISTANNVPVTGASVHLSYPTDKLAVQGVDYAGSPYSLEVAQSNSGGVLRMDRAALPVIPGGDRLFAKVTFKALGVGSAAVQFSGASYVTSGDNDSNLSLQRNGVTYTINAPQTGGSGSAPTKPSNNGGTSGGSKNTSTGGSSKPAGGNQASSGSRPRNGSSSSGSTNQSEAGNSPNLTDTSNQITDLESGSNSLLRVRVINKQNKPVQGAEVVIAGKTVKTGKDGVAEFHDIADGTQDIVVNYKGKKTMGSTDAGEQTLMYPQLVTLTIGDDTMSPLWAVIPVLALLALFGGILTRPGMRVRLGFIRNRNTDAYAHGVSSAVIGSDTPKASDITNNTPDKTGSIYGYKGPKPVEPGTMIEPNVTEPKDKDQD